MVLEKKDTKIALGLAVVATIGVGLAGYYYLIKNAAKTEKKPENKTEAKKVVEKKEASKKPVEAKVEVKKTEAKKEVSKAPAVGKKNVEASGDYKIADLSLHEFGRREIEIAEVEMPGLMSCVSKYGPS